MLEQLIRQVPLFAALPVQEVRNLVETMRTSEVSSGATLFKEGEVGDRFSIILEGKVEIVKSIGTPEERVLSVMGPGDFMGEMSLFIREGRRSASARALSEVALLETTRESFDGLIQRHPALAVEILREMANRMRAGENATIRDLQEKNRQLAQAYQELKEAQAQIIEKEKVEHELRMARNIQESILPKEMPSLPGWEIAAYWQPARSVSGDFYDLIVLPDNYLALVIGDVSGKGVPAALVMTVTCSMLRATAKRHGFPGEILAQVNEILVAEIPEHMFCTCLIILIHLETGRLCYANAGHNLPYQLACERAVELRATGMPLGLFPDRNYEEQETFLAQGDSLLLYSDGIVEAHNPRGEMYGSRRLQGQLVEQISGKQDASCAAIIENLSSQLTAFTGPDWEQEDDVTLISIRRC